jgi:hypothetical protein
MRPGHPATPAVAVHYLDLEGLLRGKLRGLRGKR